MLVGEIFPCGAVRAVIFPDGAPGALAKIGSPALPVLFARERFGEATFLFCHDDLRASTPRAGTPERLAEPALSNSESFLLDVRCPFKLPLIERQVCYFSFSNSSRHDSEKLRRGSIAFEVIIG